MQDADFVAEVDADGRIVCVWGKKRDWRGPRPIKSRDFTKRQLSDGRFFGASKAAMMNWIEKSGAEARH